MVLVEHVMRWAGHLARMGREEVYASFGGEA
jgi:hypothetical protein